MMDATILKGKCLLCDHPKQQSQRTKQWDETSETSPRSGGMTGKTVKKVAVT